MSSWALALGQFHRHQRDEFRLRSQAETPFEILNSATAVNAEILGMSGQLGTIAPGAFADFLVVDGDPLTDIGLLFEESEAISQIWARGKRVV